MHGGRVAADSPGLGRGSTFRLWLPLIERPGSLAGAVADTGQPARRVLIVDDNVDAADSLALVLQLDGHVTRTGYSAQDAFELAVAFEPEVMLLDIGLPEMDGYEVARRIRASGHPAGVKLIALTGYGQVDDVRRAEEAGFDDHLVKPVNFEALSRSLATGRRNQ
jgi:CheY-like chemotaxis protein